MALELLTSPVSDPLLPNSCQPSTTNLRAHCLCLLLRFPATFLYEILVKGPKILANSSCKVVMFLMFSFLLTYSWKLHSFLGWNKETKETVALVKKKKKGNILGKKRAAGFGRGAYILADQVFAAIVFLFSYSKSLPKSDQSLSSQKKTLYICSTEASSVQKATVLEEPVLTVPAQTFHFFPMCSNHLQSWECGANLIAKASNPPDLYDGSSWRQRGQTLTFPMMKSYGWCWNRGLGLGICSALGDPDYQEHQERSILIQHGNV